MLKIVTVPNPFLRQKAKGVEKIDNKILKIANEMLETLEKNPRRGVGLAAPQVGLSLRIILAKDGQRENSVVHALINPEIIKKSAEVEIDYEGCLSLPDTYAQVERSIKVVVKALNKNGQKVTLKASDLFARVLQHEIDHLDGILITDISVGKILTEEEYNKLIESQTKL